jgi:hypothetical protein
VSEKILTEGEWKSFAKGQKLDDPKVASKDTKALHEAVQNALQALGKTDENKPEEMLAGLDKFEGVLTKQVAANAKRKDKDGKAIKDTKEVKDQLYKMLTAVEKQRKELQVAKDKKEQAEQDAGEDEESPALLTTKMVPLIREVRKGQLVLHTLIALTGKETLVLLSRKAISPARGKLLKEQMTNPSGLKFIRGECMLEANALTFVVQSSATGLAKKLKAALLAQTELRLKVRVRGEDPEDIDEDDGGDGDAQSDEAAGAAAQGGKPPPPDAAKLAFAKRLLKLKVEVDKAAVRGDAQAKELQALLASARQMVQDGNTSGGNDELTALEKLLANKAPGGQTATDAKAGGPAPAGDVNPKVGFDARLKALFPDIQKAIAGPPPNAEVKRLLASMGFHAKKGDFGNAHAVLDEIEALLAGAAATGATAASGGPKVAAAAGANVRFQQTRLVWDQTRKKVQGELRKLEGAILEQCKTQPDMQVIAEGTKDLYSILEVLDERLIDKLDEALNATTPQARNDLQAEAGTIIEEYMAYVKSEALFDDIDDNGFVPVAIASTLNASLNAMAKQLHAAT